MMNKDLNKIVAAQKLIANVHHETAIMATPSNHFARGHASKYGDPGTEYVGYSKPQETPNDLNKVITQFKRKEQGMTEYHIAEELYNITKNQPLFPGDTISHETANECVRRGYAKRDADGNFVLTSPERSMTKTQIEKIQDIIDDMDKIGRRGTGTSSYSVRCWVTDLKNIISDQEEEGEEQQMTKTQIEKIQDIIDNLARMSDAVRNPYVFDVALAGYDVGWDDAMARTDKKWVQGNTELKEENAKLKFRITELENLNYTLTQNNVKINHDNEFLKEKCDDLKKQRDKLSKKMNIVEKENQDIFQENQRLHNRLEEI